MTKTPRKKSSETNQYTGFVQFAKEAECDESEERFNEALGKIARQKPKPEAPPEKPKTPDEKEPAK